ncbi:MarR family transcriptional regulator [Terrilactibacillus sp. S3-3]|nr:MarR family transcriptional regulator [Terrilactibacillus sp. S3-3]
MMEHDKCTNTELAKVFYVKKSAITAMTTRLFNKGMIKRRRDNKDRRIVYLSLTQEGREFLTTCDQKAIAIVAEFIDRFESTEIEQFFQTYEKLNNILTLKLGKLEE